MSTPASTHTRRRRVFLIGGGILLVLLITVATTWWMLRPPRYATTAEIGTTEPDIGAVIDAGSDFAGKDLTGKPVRGTTEITDDTLAAMNQVPNTGDRFRIPSAGIDIPLGDVTSVGGILEPTNYTSAFRVRNIGVPENDTDHGTTYIIMHACDYGATCPGNFLIEGSDITVAEGDAITVAENTFTVEMAFTAGKDELQYNPTVWDTTIPNRLIVITCLPHSDSNIIIKATTTESDTP